VSEWTLVWCGSCSHVRAPPPSARARVRSGVSSTLGERVHVHCSFGVGSCSTIRACPLPPPSPYSPPTLPDMHAPARMHRAGTHNGGQGAPLAAYNKSFLYFWPCVAVRGQSMQQLTRCSPLKVNEHAPTRTCGTCRFISSPSKSALKGLRVQGGEAEEGCAARGEGTAAAH